MNSKFEITFFHILISAFCIYIGLCIYIFGIRVHNENKFRVEIQNEFEIKINSLKKEIDLEKKEIEHLKTLENYFYNKNEDLEKRIITLELKK
jgi:protein associated with RNAse G/E